MNSIKLEEKYTFQKNLLIILQRPPCEAKRYSQMLLKISFESIANRNFDARKVKQAYPNVPKIQRNDKPNTQILQNAKGKKEYVSTMEAMKPMSIFPKYREITIQKYMIYKHQKNQDNALWDLQSSTKFLCIESLVTLILYQKRWTSELFKQARRRKKST